VLAVFLCTSLGFPRSESGIMIFSTAVRYGINAKFCMTKPMLFRRKPASSLSEASCRCIPLKKIFPEDGRISPPNARSRVVFPAPEGPVIVTKEPFSILSEISLRAKISPFLRKYRLVSFSVCIITLNLLHVDKWIDLTSQVRWDTTPDQ